MKSIIKAIKLKSNKKICAMVGWYDEHGDYTEMVSENIALKDIDESVARNIDLKHDITIHIAPQEEIAVFARTMKVLNEYIERENNTGGVRRLLDAFGMNPKGNGDYIYTSFNLDRD
jgi:hypothetical protein